MAVTPDKVQIGTSNDFLDGVSVDTGAGTGLFRETVVIADPENGGGLANIRELGTQLVTGDKGLVTNTTIHGLTTGGGGGFVDVKVTPSGALTVESTVTGTVSVAGEVTIAELVTVDGAVSIVDGAVLSIAFQASASGQSTVLTPAAGKAIRLYWYNIGANPANAGHVTAALRFGAGGTDFFKTALSQYGGMISHSFKSGASFIQGAVNAPLVLVLDASQSVFVNIDYEEV